MKKVIFKIIRWIWNDVKKIHKGGSLLGWLVGIFMAFIFTIYKPFFLDPKVEKDQLLSLKQKIVDEKKQVYYDWSEIIKYKEKIENNILDKNIDTTGLDLGLNNLIEEVRKCKEYESWKARGDDYFSKKEYQKAQDEYSGVLELAKGLHLDTSIVVNYIYSCKKNQIKKKSKPYLKKKIVNVPKPFQLIYNGMVQKTSDKFYLKLMSLVREGVLDTNKIRKISVSLDDSNPAIDSKGRKMLNNKPFVVTVGKKEISGVIDQDFHLPVNYFYNDIYKHICKEIKKNLEKQN